MNAKLPISLSHLSSWIEKIIFKQNHESDLRNFIEVHNIKELIKFYQELLPFMDDIRKDLPQINHLIDEYYLNEKLFNKELQPKSTLLNWVLTAGNFFSNDASTAYLINTLKKIKDNIDNILYQLRINEK